MDLETPASLATSLMVTDIKYLDVYKRQPEGKTKIAVLWDQNTDTVYSEDEINAAILSENPYESIPGDEDGHCLLYTSRCV